MPVTWSLFVDIDDDVKKGSSVFSNSLFGEALNTGLLNIPHEGQLPNTTRKDKFCFIGDEAFPLKEAKTSMRSCAFSTTDFKSKKGC